MICSCDKHLDLVEKSNFLLTLLLTLVSCVFCDDTLIAKEIEQKSDAFELQTDLNNILEWTKLWGMNFNTDKCLYMTVTNKRKFIQNNLNLNNVALKQKQIIKY